MSVIILGHSRPARRVARTVVISLSAFLLCLSLSYLIFLRWTRIDPPDAPEADAQQRPVEVHGQRAAVGQNWASRERGVWEYHLSGDPFDMGYAQSRLGNRLLMETEEYMFSEMNRYVPSRLSLSLIRAGVLLRYRHLPDVLTEAERLELFGLSRGFVDLHGDFLPPYHRVLLYHALHDITQTLEHSPLLGCTAFAAAGPATVNGHLLIGRNFDFEGPPIFDRDKAVLFFKPRGKIPFASVAWTGMMGVVTGLNAEGVFLSVNAARTEDKSQQGVPVELLLREVLERARSLNEALDLLKARPVLVPDFYLVGDGKSGEAAVVERSPTRFEVRRSKEMIGLTNHGLTKPFVGDRENERLRTSTTSAARMNRLQELLGQYRGTFDVHRVLATLRDKRGVGGEALGLGNRNALDAIIATHSVVVDATSLILWVGVGPHELGRYAAFDLRKELLDDDRPATMDLPEDPALTSEDYRAYQQALREIESAQGLARLGELDRAIEEADKAEALQQRMPEAHRLLADLLRQRGDQRRGDLDRARRHYQRFLEVQPPYVADAEAVRAILKAM